MSSFIAYAIAGVIIYALADWLGLPPKVSAILTVLLIGYLVVAG